MALQLVFVLVEVIFGVLLVAGIVRMALLSQQLEAHLKKTGRRAGQSYTVGNDRSLHRYHHFTALHLRRCCGNPRTI